jgi:hypothetical protein
MQESAMSATKTLDYTFLHSMANQIATQPDRNHQFKMEIRKHKILTEGIETQQKLMGQQLINQRTENESPILLQNANIQLQLYQS